MLILFWAAAAAAGTPAATQPANVAPGNPGIVVIAPKEKKVCVVELSTGTRAGSRRICRTVSEERDERRLSQETVREMQEQIRIQNSLYNPLTPTEAAPPPVRSPH
jgi:hypothetical protein